MGEKALDPTKNPAVPHNGPGPLTPCAVPEQEEEQNEPLPKEDSTDD